MKRKAAEAEAGCNTYAGWCLPSSGAPIERLDAGSIEPEEFYSRFVRPRRPVVLTGRLPDEEWRADKRWTNDYLRAVAGEAKVRVELATGNERVKTAAGSKKTKKTKKKKKKQMKRHNSEECEVSPVRFGAGNHTYMKFAAFLDLLEAGNAQIDGSGAQHKVFGSQVPSSCPPVPLPPPQCYLTTQDEVIDTDSGQPNPLSSPCLELRAAGDFPLVPTLMGNLQPLVYNMWMGSAPPLPSPSSLSGGKGANKEGEEEGAGTSSGLHHDYQDNLYCLLRGRKRFRLISPSYACKLPTAGTIRHVHSNGLVNYEGQEPTNTSGAALSSLEDDANSCRVSNAKAATVAATQSRDNAEAALAAAEAAEAAGEEGAAEALAEAEQMMDDAMDEALLMMGVNEGCEDDDDDDNNSDSVFDLAAGFDGVDDFDDLDDDDNEDTQLEPEQKKMKTSAGKTSSTKKKKKKKKKKKQKKCAVSLPDNFCRTSCPDGAFIDTTVYLNAGDMLFLPSGWFHEVTSMNSVLPVVATIPVGVKKNKKNKRGKGLDPVSSASSSPGHLAFNYWFHPADINGTFAQPYVQ